MMLFAILRAPWRKNNQTTPEWQVLAELSNRLQHCHPEPESRDLLVLQQIGLLLELLPELSELNKRISQPAYIPKGHPSWPVIRFHTIILFHTVMLTPQLY